MKQKVLASIICSLFISGNVQAHTQGFEIGKDNIALGDTAVAVGNGNISIGTGAVAVGNGMNKAQIEAAIKQQQALVNEISLLKNSIKSNEAKNQSYLDTVDKIERNKQIIADLQSKLDSSKLENINLSQEYQDTKTRYDFQKAIIDDKKKIISQLDFSKITDNWETDGGLDALAQEFKAKAEKDVGFTFGDDFYKDYLKKYINVSTKVDHESKIFDSVKGSIDFRNSGVNMQIQFSNLQEKFNLTGEMTFLQFDKHITETNLAINKAKTEATYEDFKQNFDTRIQEIKNSDPTLGKLLTDDMVQSIKTNAEKNIQAALSSIRLKELEHQLYSMSSSDPTFNKLYKEFEALKNEYTAGNLGAHTSIRDEYQNYTQAYKNELIVSIQKENQANIKKLEDALNSELTDITTEMNAIVKKLAANQKLIDNYVKDIANRQPTAEELAAYEEALKVQAELQKQRDQLAGKENSLNDLQQNMQDGENAIAIGTNAIASGKASIALGNATKAYGNRSVAIGDGAISNNEFDVALGADSVTEKAVVTESISIAGKSYNFAGTNPIGTVSIGSKGKERTLTNLASGRISSSSTDAINGSQLFASNQAIEFVNSKADSNQAAIENLETNINNNIEKNINIVKTEVKNVDGKVNQLGESTASVIGGGTYYDKNTGKLSTPVFVIQSDEYTNVGHALKALDGQISNHSLLLVQNQNLIQTNTNNINQNTTDITNLFYGLENGTLGLVQQNPLTGIITIGASKKGSELNLAGLSGNRVLSGVANGRVAQNSNEAINGGQLWETEQRLDSKIDNSINNNNTVINENIDRLEGKTDELGRGTASALGGGAEYNPTTGTLKQPEYHVQAGIQNSVEDALNSLDTQVNTHTGNIINNTTEINNIKNGLEDGTIGLVQQDQITGVITVGKDKGGSEVNLSGTDGNRVVSGVADGRVEKGSNQAVNGGQLWDTEQRLEGLIGETIINNTVINENIDRLEGKTNELGRGTASALGGGSVYNPDTGKLSAPTYEIQGGQHNNVGSALTSLDSKVSENSAAIIQNSTDILINKTNIEKNTTEINNINTGLENGTIGLVQQDQKTGVITVGKMKGGNEISMAGTDGNRVISGIADGRVAQGSNEAINGGQLHTVVQQLENQNENRYNALNSRINHNRKVASQGIASAMAMQIDMPEADPNGWSGGVGMATYDGETAMAVGTHYLSTTGKHKFSTSISTGLGSWSKPAAKIGWGFKM